MSGLILRESDHTYWLGAERFPSVSEIIKPVCNYGGVPEDVLERKSEIGRATHLFAEWHDTKVEFFANSVDPAVKPYLKAWKKFCAEMKPKWEEVERKRHHPVHRFAGTNDRIGIINGKRWLIDIKTVATISPATGLQTAAYQKLYEYGLVDHESGIDKRAAVQLKNDGTYRLVEFFDKADWPTFLSLLTIHYWSKKHGV